MFDACINSKLISTHRNTLHPLGIQREWPPSPPFPSFDYVCRLHEWTALYRVIQKERSIFWDGIVSVIVTKKIYMNMCAVLSVYRDRAVRIYKHKIVANGNKES
jgi:hypothetical protein